MVDGKLSLGTQIVSYMRKQYFKVNLLEKDINIDLILLVVKTKDIIYCLYI